MATWKQRSKDDKDLIKSLTEENFEIAQKHLRRYAQNAIYMEIPFGEMKSRIEEMVEKILEEV